jgi:hypothetical protein
MDIDLARIGMGLGSDGILCVVFGLKDIGFLGCLHE